MLGQGEGLDRAAKWLNQSPNAKEITAASWYTLVFGSYFQGKTLAIPFSNPDELSDLNWTKANRVVLYVNQLQRQLPEPKMLAYFAAQQPLYTVQVDEIDYAMVYPGPLCLPEDLENIQFPLSLSFGEQVLLLGYDLNSSKLKSGDELVVSFYWEFLKPPSSDLTIKMSLRNENGELLDSLEANSVNSYLPDDRIFPDAVVRDVHQLKISTGTPPGRYQLELKWFSPNKEQALEVRDATGNSQGSQGIIGELEIIRQTKS